MATSSNGATLANYDLTVIQLDGNAPPPDILRKVSTAGFIRLQTHPEQVEATLAQLGEMLGKRTSIIPLAHNSEQSGPSLPWHIDGYYQTPLPTYFMLGCCFVQCRGGATLLKDGRLIATRLIGEYPELKNVIIHYERTVPESYQERTIPLIQDLDGTPILAYRANIPKLPGLEQTIVNLGGFANEEEIYSIVDKAIEAAPIAIEHHWSAGQILIAHNLFFLHSRKDYSGERQMMRAQCFPY
ncbi:MAG: TauD/TfdA family dioxygenase [Hormoscilla sp.]